MEVGDKISIVGLLPFNKMHLQNKEGTVVSIDEYKAFPVLVLVNGKIESFTLQNVKKQ